jgi:hypothetical protein
MVHGIADLGVFYFAMRAHLVIPSGFGCHSIQPGAEPARPDQRPGGGRLG